MARNAGIAAVDDLLRGEGRHSVGGGRVPAAQLGLMVIGFGFFYGAVMGAYGVRPLQSCYSGAKVPLLLGVATVICLPSYYVINCLLGLRRDFASALRGVLAAQATLAVAIASLSPVTALAYASGEGYRFAIAFNGLMFALGAAAGQLVLARHYRPLIRTNPRHRIARNVWLTLYVFVAIQMAWVLRPFIGAPGLEVRFFRQDAWSNAYVEVVNILAGLLREM